jgi:sortase A
MPGQVGNTVISGHRTTNGAPFYNLDRLERGDTISIETVIGTHTYEARPGSSSRPTPGSPPSGKDHGSL